MILSRGIKSIPNSVLNLVVSAIELDSLFLDTAWEPREFRNEVGFILSAGFRARLSVGVQGCRSRDSDGQSCEILVIKFKEFKAYGMIFCLDDTKTKTLAESHILAPKHRTARVLQRKLHENIYMGERRNSLILFQK